MYLSLCQQKKILTYILILNKEVIKMAKNMYQKREERKNKENNNEVEGKTNIN